MLCDVGGGVSLGVGGVSLLGQTSPSHSSHPSHASHHAHQLASWPEDSGVTQVISFSHQSINYA